MKNLLTGEDVNISVTESLTNEYNLLPTESKMWEIWLFCDDHRIPLPDVVRKRLRVYALDRVKDNEPPMLKEMLRKITRLMIKGMSEKGISESKAAEIMADALDSDGGPQSILRDYQRYKNRKSDDKED